MDNIRAMLPNPLARLCCGYSGTKPVCMKFCSHSLPVPLASIVLFDAYAVYAIVAACSVFLLYKMGFETRGLEFEQIRG